jgi:hypothetical protein
MITWKMYSYCSSESQDADPCHVQVPPAAAKKVAEK